MEPDQPRLATVLVSASTYVSCWWAVLTLHVVTALVALFASFAHLTLSIEVFHRATSAILIPVPLKRLTGLGYLLVAGLHGITVTRMCTQSLRSGQLLLQPEHTSPRSLAQPLSPRARFSRSRRAYRSIRNLQDKTVGANGYFGIHGPFFSSSLLLRETVEVLMQSYQLWSLSYNISREWINYFAVATVVLNCLSIPIVNALFHRWESQRRLAHLTVDMLLDFACAVVIPMLVMVPLMLQFDFTSSAYPIHLILDDVWFANSVAEARQVLVTSYLDMFSSLLPHYSIYNCLRLIKRLVGHHSTRGHSLAIVPLRVVSQQAAKQTHGPRVLVNDARMGKESRVVRVVSACFVVWGALVFGLHVYANRFKRSVDRHGCQLVVRPWLVQNVSCSVMHVNCHYWNTSGAAHEVALVLDPLERTVVTKIVFVHCPQLTVPNNIVEFPRLTSVLIYNSTVVDWPLSAAIRQTTHPSLSDIYFTRTNVATIPPGILHSDLPQSLSSIAFYNSSLAEIPETLGKIWSKSGVQRIGLEFTNVSVIPASIGRLGKLWRLWLVQNPIESFPDDAFARSRFGSIRLSGMALQELPNAIGDTSALQELVVEHTNVSHLPLWASAWLDTHSRADDMSIRSFYGSPLCDPAASTVTTEAIAAWRICEQDRHSQYGEIPYEILHDQYSLEILS